MTDRIGRLREALAAERLCHQSGVVFARQVTDAAIDALAATEVEASVDRSDQLVTFGALHAVVTDAWNRATGDRSCAERPLAYIAEVLREESR